jgi:hypothetical protein
LQAILAESGEELIDTAVRHFQATRDLDVDGKLGPITREAILTEYMAIDGTTLPDGIELIAHGCGENFPLDKIDAADAKVGHAHDRRVELFCFDADLGVLPPPQGESSPAGSAEYPEWRRRSVETHDFVVDPFERFNLHVRSGLTPRDLASVETAFVLRSSDGLLEERSPGADDDTPIQVDFENLDLRATYDLRFVIDGVEVPVFEGLPLLEGAVPVDPEKLEQAAPPALEGTGLRSKEHAQELFELAVASEDVYGGDFQVEIGKFVTRYTRPDVVAMKLDPDLFFSSSGFAAGLYQIQDGTFVIACRGTEPKDVRDIIVNVLQAHGKKSGQYEDAIRLARSVVDRLGTDTLVTGHSLGGGLAAVAALASGCRAVTFNAAGVHPRTLQRHLLPRDDFFVNERITNVVLEGDILTRVQESALAELLVFNIEKGMFQLDTPTELPEALGIRLGIEPVNQKLNTLEKHAIEHVIATLLHEKGGRK